MVADSQAILMVDDEYDMVECIKLWLQRLELDASGFTDPLLPLEYFKNNCNSISLVLIDIRIATNERL